MLFVQQVVGYGADDVVWRLVATVFWIVIIHATLLLLDMLLFGARASDTWQASVPTLLRDIGRIFLVLFGAAFVLADIWNVDLIDGELARARALLDRFETKARAKAGPAQLGRLLKLIERARAHYASMEGR